MKKSLASALASMILMPSAFAQDSVTLYGIIDMGLQYLKTQQDLPGQRDSNTFLGMANGVQSGSRFGLKGLSDLGGNTSVRFVLENGFNPGNGTAAQGGLLFGRQATIGLVNQDLGQVDVGRRSNLATSYFDPIDPFGEGFGQANIGASFGTANTLRYNNLVLAQSAPIGGLTFGAGYSFATGLSTIYVDNGSCSSTGCHISNNNYQYLTGNNLRAITLGVKYQQGPLYLAAAYDQLNGPNDIQNGPPSPNPTAWMIGGLYDFTSIKISGAFGQTRHGSVLGQAEGTGSAAGNNLTNTTLGAGALFSAGFAHNSYLLGLTIPTNTGSVIASWQMMQPTGDYKTDGVSAQSVYSVGYLYSLTKRTNVYAYASYANNFAMVDTARSTVLGIGMRHQF
jgi:predicted porin